jgi:hypothetical protein
MNGAEAASEPAQLVALIDVAPAPAVLVDRFARRVVHVNAAARFALGASAENDEAVRAALIGCAVRGVSAGEATPLEAGSTRFRLRAATADGGRWAAVWLTPLAPDADALASVRAQLQLTMDAVGVGVWERDLATGAVRWSDEMYALTGTPRERAPLSADEMLAYVHPEDRARVAAARVHALAAGEIGDVEFRFLRSDGAERCFNARGRVVAGADGAPRLVGVLLDVTARSHAERQRQALAQRMQLAAQLAGVGLWERDGRAERVYWDERTREFFGVGPDFEPTHEAWLRALHPADRERAARELESAVAHGGRGYMQFRIVRPNGETRFIVSTFDIERDAAGRALRVLGVNLDATATQRAAAESSALLERLQLATEAVGLGIFEWDPVHDTTACDERFRAILGLPAGANPTYAQWIALVHPDDRARTIAEWQRLMESACAGTVEYRLLRSDGAVRDVHTTVRVRRDAAGRALHVLGATLDVTELRAAERAAHERAERLRLTAESAGVGMYDWDEASDRTLWDEQTWRIFGYPAPQAASCYDLWIARLHPDDRARVERELHEVLATQAQYESHYRVCWPDGSVRHIVDRGVVQRDATGRATGLIGIVWDQTARHQAEAAAREAAERLALAASSAGIGTWDLDLAARALICDAQTYRLFRRTADDGSPLAIWRSAVVPDDRARAEQTMRRAIEGNGQYESEFRATWPDGETRYIASRGLAQRGADGRVRRLIGVCWDVTEARRAEAALRAKETAERANRAKSEFLSRMSHELRTPLNAILGFTQLLELDKSDPPSAAQRERLGQIHAAGGHLLQLINDVLDLARIETGRIAVSIETVALDGVLADALAMVEPELRRRGLALARERDAGAPRFVWADRTRLKQVLLNLLSNAIKYNRPRGSVRVAVRRADDGGVVIAVRDTGVGLSAQQIDKLFQPFNRLGLEHIAPEGTGIGLAISLRLVEQMRGRLEVSSEPGVGSEFRVSLQEAVVDAQAPHCPAAEAPALQARDDVQGAVLYIEDNPANSALVQQFLQWRPNVRLYAAPDGATGVVLAAVCRPDLVLMDLQLPDLHGTEVLRQLRLQPGTEHLCCVAVSANATPQAIEAARSAGFADYWTKPLDAVAFLAGVDRYLKAAVERALD